MGKKLPLILSIHCGKLSIGLTGTRGHFVAVKGNEHPQFGFCVIVDHRVTLINNGFTARHGMTGSVGPYMGARARSFEQFPLPLWIQPILFNVVVVFGLLWHGDLG